MIEFFVENFSEYVWIAIFLIALLPTFETRIAIPFGLAFSNLHPIIILLFAYIGSLIPIIPVSLFVNKISKNLNFEIFKKNKNYLKIQSNNKEINRLLLLGSFVAIPLPLTGVWSGSIIAGISNLNFKKSFLSISIGSFIASCIVLIISLFFKSSVIYYLLFSLIFIFLVLILKLLTFFIKKK